MGSHSVRRVVADPLSAVILSLVLGACSVFGFSRAVRFGYGLLAVAGVVAVIAVVEWWRREHIRLRWPIAKAKPAPPEQVMDFVREWRLSEFKSHELLTQLQEWGRDAPARKYWKQVLDTFPDLTIGSARNIFDLVYLAYQKPFTEIPLKCERDPDQHDEPDFYKVDLYPISFVFVRRFGEGTILRSRIRQLVEGAKQDACTDARLTPPAPVPSA